MISRGLTELNNPAKTIVTHNNVYSYNTCAYYLIIIKFKYDTTPDFISKTP